MTERQTGDKRDGKKLAVKIAVIAVLLAVYALVLYWANSGWNGYTVTEDSGTEYESARVLSVLEDNTVTDDSYEGYSVGSTVLEIEIQSGRYKGDVVEVTNYLSALYNVDVGEGDWLTVRIDTSGVDEYTVSVYNYYRTPWLLLFVAIFALALIALGGFQGLRAFLGLIFAFVSTVFLLVPLTLRGYPSVPMTVILVGLTAAVGFYLLGGWQPKTVGAALGCICGVCFAALLGALATQLIHVSAYQSDEAEALMLAQAENGLQIRGLFLSSVLITALGAVMDIAMSVASAMDELKEKRPDISTKELFLSGVKVGRDATGTMANTLVLAIAGSSFNMMVLIYSYQVSFTQLMNTDFVAIELIRGIAGSLGIVLAVPCVAAITAPLLDRFGPGGAATAPPESSAGTPGRKKRKNR
ncbi:MAG: YibE/F family protein [Clostridiales bacterium]|nr:YibE/F family protein [Clostridiales bacterium]